MTTFSYLCIGVSVSFVRKLLGYFLDPYNNFTNDAMNCIYMTLANLELLLLSSSPNTSLSFSSLPGKGSIVLSSNQAQRS